MLRILHLVLYSTTDPIYVAMRNATLQWYEVAAFNHCVMTVYYCWNPALPRGTYRYTEAEMLLELGGEETFLPGILEKTVLTFQLMHVSLDMMDFDYVVRSNVSTVVDFRVLSRSLQQWPVNYGGTSINVIDDKYCDPPCGLTDGRYCGLSYGTGCCIVLSRDAFLWLVQPEVVAQLDYSVIDDVALGHLLVTQFGEVQRLRGSTRIHVAANQLLSQPHIERAVQSGKVAVYRNQLGPGKRHLDVQRVEWIVRGLLETHIKQTCPIACSESGEHEDGTDLSATG